MSNRKNQNNGVDLVISSSDADATVRTIAVKELVKSIAGKQLEELEELVSVILCFVRLTTNFSACRRLYEILLLPVCKTATKQSWKPYMKFRQL